MAFLALKNAVSYIGCSSQCPLLRQECPRMPSGKEKKDARIGHLIRVIAFLALKDAVRYVGCSSQRPLLCQECQKMPSGRDKKMLE